jgi:pimeloyl-ACP methyl ester carboxylesterase
VGKAVLDVATQTGTDSSEKPFYASTQSGLVLGIAHMPKRRTSKTGVILLNSGQQNRAGPQRLYVSAAREIAEAGIACFRVDMPGVGDSHGLQPEFHFDCYAVKDVMEIIDYITQEFGFSKVILLGLCAGARVGVKTAAVDSRVSGVVAWGVPILTGPPDMPSSPEIIPGDISESVAKDQLRQWRDKVVRPSAWADFIGSKKSLVSVFRRSVKVIKKLGGRNTASPLQTHFLDAMDAYLASPRKALFVYGELDRQRWIEFKDRYEHIDNGSDANRSLVIVEGGNHTFRFIEAREEAIRVTTNWLRENFTE